MPTPYEDLVRANHDYHEAVDGLLMSEELSVEVKVELGSICDSIFAMMLRVNNLIEGQEEIDLP